MTAPNWTFLQLYYVTRQTFTGDSSSSLLSKVCSAVKNDYAEKLVSKWYHNGSEWSEVREHYNDDKKFLKEWSQYLLVFREARKASELADVSKES